MWEEKGKSSYDVCTSCNKLIVKGNFFSVFIFSLRGYLFVCRKSIGKRSIRWNPQMVISEHKLLLLGALEIDPPHKTSPIRKSTAYILLNLSGFLSWPTRLACICLCTPQWLSLQTVSPTWSSLHIHKQFTLVSDMYILLQKSMGIVIMGSCACLDLAWQSFSSGLFALCKMSQVNKGSWCLSQAMLVIWSLDEDNRNKTSYGL